MAGTYAKMTFILHNTLMSAHHSFVSAMANEAKKKFAAGKKVFD